MSLHSSQFNRNGHRDDRRRRLLTEEHGSAAASGGGFDTIEGKRTTQLTLHKSENYGDAGFMDEQLRLVDLIPRRVLTFALLLLLGAAAIFGLEALHVWIPNILPKDDGRVAMLDLTSPGSLANWFSSLMLLTAAVVSLQVYSIRRHKVDDYHGRYRVWLWAAMCWLLLATDVSTGLHQAVQQIMIGVTGTRVIGDGSIWWIVPAAFLFGAIGSRLVIDMHDNRLSTATLILSAGCYTAAVVIHTSGLLPSGVNQILALQGTWMAGHLLLLLAMGLHARYVILDAEGLLPRRAVKTKEKKAKTQPKLAIAKTGDDSAEEDDSEEAKDDSSDEWVAVDSPHAKLQPVLKRVGLVPSPAAAAAVSKPAAVAKVASPSADVADDSANQKLSKADRKALKRRLLDERLQREQKKTSGWGK